MHDEVSRLRHAGEREPFEARLQAVILAAGCGRRLGADTPKGLLEVGGRILVERHLDALGDVPVTLVVGYEARRFRALLGDRVSYAHNLRYAEAGVIHSLAIGLSRLRDDDLVVMDADVIYPPELLRRLFDAPAEIAFAVDRRSAAGSEEMMVTVHGGRVHEISRCPQLPFDWMGETAGFTKIAASAVDALRAAVASAIADGENGDYEVALDRLVKQREAGVVEINDLPWTEIDFQDDLANARRLFGAG